MRQVIWKKSCASVSSGALNDICKIHRAEENNQSEPSWSLAVYESRLSANSDQTVKLGSADQIWINILLL